MNEAYDHPAGTPSHTDQTLIRRFQRGEEDAATALYLRYAERLRRSADQQMSAKLSQRLDADDIVQSVFRTFFRRVADGQYDLVQRDDLWKLLLVMALNKIRNAGNYHLADKRTIAKTQLLSEADGRVDGLNEHSEMALQVLKLTIDEVIQAAPEEHREIIYLRIEGHEVDEIVAKTGRAKRSIERILQSFRKLLVKSLDLP